MSEGRVDILKRAGWTVLQAALGVITVELVDAPLAYAPIVAAVLSVVKSWVAQRVEASRG
jgi:hypothetical protein